mmetsp:Transcript_13599/g.21330  ORF Transcript_13599/g.21330 Transcript_13599/m.21330 type:complete len:202 (-) Transcript_13599:465-1070(-)
MGGMRGTTSRPSLLPCEQSTTERSSQFPALRCNSSRSSKVTACPNWWKSARRKLEWVTTAIAGSGRLLSHSKNRTARSLQCSADSRSSVWNTSSSCTSSLQSKPGNSRLTSRMVRRPSQANFPQRSRHSSRTRNRGGGTGRPTLCSGVPGGASPAARKAGTPGGLGRPKICRAVSQARVSGETTTRSKVVNDLPSDGRRAR